MFIYVTFDSNGFVTDYKKVETDGYTKVFVLDLNTITIKKRNYLINCPRIPIRHPINSTI